MASNNRRAITPVGTLSYPHLFTPQDPMEEGGVPKYGAALIFPEGTDISELRQIVKVAALEFFGEARAAKLLKAKKLRLPFRDDGEEKGYPENSVYINAKTKDQPEIVSRYQDPETGEAQVIEDQALVYPGMQARFSVTAFGYDVKGNRGVAFGLNGVQKWADGERLDGRISARKEFDAEAPVTADLPGDDADEQEEEGGIDALM